MLKLRFPAEIVQCGELLLNLVVVDQKSIGPLRQLLLEPRNRCVVLRPRRLGQEPESAEEVAVDELKDSIDRLDEFLCCLLLIWENQTCGFCLGFSHALGAPQGWSRVGWIELILCGHVV